MRMRWSDLWSTTGTLDRGPYAAWGLLLVAIKYNLDRLLAYKLGKMWYPFSYLVTSRHDVTEHRSFYLTLAVLSVPFIWAGTAMTVRRLRSLALPVGWVVLFFLPGLNLLFFLLLALIPARQGPEADRPESNWLARFIPHSPLGSAAIAVVLSLVLGVLTAALAVQYLRDYGWGLFVGLPFCMGLVSSLLAGYHYPRSFGACALVACLSIGLAGAALLAVAVEGAICLAMAAPLALMLALLGGALGYFLQWTYWRRNAVLLLLVLAAPSLVLADVHWKGPAPLWTVTTTLEIDAPPASVWPHVVQFSELPPPREWLFATGIAYPIRARLVNRVRYCEFTTGPFVEPITAWEPPHRLAFSVSSQPAPMHELSPYHDLRPAHTEHFLVSEKGEFRLEELPGGRTRIVGTTWYRHDLWPAAYWKPLSDYVLHAIHRRVLQHIRHEVESSRQG